MGVGFGALNASEPQLSLNGSGSWHLVEQLLGGSPRCTSCLCTHLAPRVAHGGTQEALIPFCLQGKCLHFREQSAVLTLVPTFSICSLSASNPSFQSQAQASSPCSPPPAQRCQLLLISDMAAAHRPGRCFWLPAGPPSHNHQRDYRIVATT